MPTYPDFTVYPASGTIAALAGTRDTKTGLHYIPTDTSPSDTPTLEEQFNRDKHRLALLLAVESEGQVFQENYSGLTIGVCPLNYVLGGAQKSYAGATGQAVTNNATNYVYLNSSNALTMSTVSFPADITTFVPLAIVVAASGVITSVTDARGYARTVVPTATSTGTTGTNNTSWTVDEDNAGACADPQLRFQRGSSNVEDAALEWKESAGRVRVRSQHSTDTLAGVDCSEVAISGTAALDSNGAAKVQSAVAGSGLQHSAGVLSVATASASGTQISGGIVAVDPSDGIAIDANGVAVSLTANGGLALSGSAGSKTLGVSTDGTTTGLDGSGAVEVKNNGLTGNKAANQSTSSGTPGTFGILLRAQIVAGNTVTIHNANAPFKYRVVDAWSIAQSADGGTWKLDNGTNDITNAVTVTGTDKTRNGITTLDDAYWEIAASGTLRVVGDGALADVTVYVLVERVA
jgi:hypothetical protein